MANTTFFLCTIHGKCTFFLLYLPWFMHMRKPWQMQIAKLYLPWFTHTCVYCICHGSRIPVFTVFAMANTCFVICICHANNCICHGWCIELKLYLPWVMHTWFYCISHGKCKFCTLHMPCIFPTNNCICHVGYIELKLYLPWFTQNVIYAFTMANACFVLCICMAMLRSGTHAGLPLWLFGVEKHRCE